jgi:hypothetical protein
MSGLRQIITDINPQQPNTPVSITNFDDNTYNELLYQRQKENEAKYGRKDVSEEFYPSGLKKSKPIPIPKGGKTKRKNLLRKTKNKTNKKQKTRRRYKSKK